MKEMYQHCIFVCSNYTAKTRDGLHFLYNETNIDEVMSIVKKYTAKEGVAFYFVVTDEPTIESVQKKDRFFKSINILEGTDPNSINSFNNSINNQISVMDVALLLLSQEKMTIKELNTYLFYIYCLYANKYDSFPFKEKYYFGKGELGFKNINFEFASLDGNDLLECTKPNIIMSKFFNSEKGVELMNKVLEIFYKLKEKDISFLYDKYIQYHKKCIKKYKIGDNETRYQFRLVKKSIKSLGINAD